MEIRAVDGISFRVKAGEIFGLLGPNGAGKSTTVKILTTITQPTSGSARVAGYDVVKQPRKVREQLTVVLQETAVEMLLSVEDNLDVFGRLHHLSRRHIRERTERMLDAFGLREKRFEKVNDLSAGLRRRLQVAKVFLVDSPVVFLDEATTGMDPLTKRQTLDMIRAEARKGRTFVLTTQVLEEAEELCDTIVILNKGKIVAQGNLSQLQALASRLFRVSLVFAHPSEAATHALHDMQPLSMECDGAAAELTFKGKEAALLTKLSKISESFPIERFEVRGADLEDIFVELLGRENS